MSKILFSFFAMLLNFNTFADSIALKNGATIDDCTILQENADHVAILYGVSILRIERSEVDAVTKESKTDSPAKTEVAASLLPDYRAIILKLSTEKWAVDLQQIPATVVSVGILRNVPYKSHKANDGYEINIYGDPAAPAGFEIGVKNTLLKDEHARTNCIEFVCSLLKNAADCDALRALKRDKDIVVRNGVTYEITPSSDPDAYGGWWVSVYSETGLNSVRASDKELEAITVAKTAVPAPLVHTAVPLAPRNDMDARSAWTTEDLNHARVVRANPEHPVDERVYVRGFARHGGAFVPHHRTIVIRR